MSEDIKQTREHPILASRKAQLDLNLKAIRGGGDYIDARLNRHACESDVSWNGKGASAGRKKRATYTNYAGRIADKINQLVASGGVARDAADPLFLRDATGTGVSLHDLMDRVGSCYTAAGWCWIGVDRMAAEVADGQPKVASVLETKMKGDRVWWSVWPATSIVDWKLAPSGAIEWVITESTETVSGTPDEPAKTYSVRSVYTIGQCQKIKTDLADKGAEPVIEVIPLTIQVIPFVLVGVPSVSPWWFDDAERICASLMNLQSCHDENLYQAGFPQLVVPTGLIRETMADAGVNYSDAVELVRGLNAPLAEPDSASGLTRYIQPDASSSDTIPNELARKRRELYEVVGLALKNESAQVESAEAKRLGNLDVSAVIRQRAAIMSAAEKAAIALSRIFDPTFPDYEPVYPESFDSSDSGESVKVIRDILETPMPDSARRAGARALAAELARAGKVDKDTMKTILADIEEMDFSLDASLSLLTAPANADGAAPEDGQQAGDSNGQGEASTVQGDPMQEPLNGAQVSSLVEIATQVATGQLPDTTGRAIAAAAFPAVAPALIDKIFGGLSSFKPRVVESAKPQVEPSA